MTALTERAASDLFRAPPHRFLDVGQGEVAYRRVGEGPDVLFIYGWPAHAATFRRLLPHLAPHLTCHLIDLPGAGDSRFGRDTRIDLEQHVANVRRVVELLELDSVSVVGHDSGGLIARHALGEDPRLRSMALVDTEQPQGLGWRFAQFLLAGRAPGFIDLFAHLAMRPRLRRNRMLLGDCFEEVSLLDGEFEEFFLAPLRDDPERRWAAGHLLRHFDRRLVDELPELHARITAPVQLVWGANDPFFPVALAREMVDTFPDAALHVVPGARLFVHEERPEEVARAILPVLLGERAASAVALTG